MDESGISRGANAPRLVHIPEIDGLRAIACLLVIFFHAAPDTPVPGGFLGVDLFFVLSGYLITDLLVAEQEAQGKITVGRFYLQRALRLVPALLLFLATYVTIAPFVWPGQPHFRDAGLAALYLSDYSYPLFGSPHYIRHSWSLAVEEQFYLLWPLLIPLMVRKRQAIAMLAAAWVTMSFVRYSIADSGWMHHYFALHTHSSGLIAGALLALARRERPFTISAPMGTYAFLLFAIMALTANIASSAVAITMAELLSIILVGCIVSGARPAFVRLLAARPLIGIGRLSYGLYLWHFPFSYYFGQKFSFSVSASATFACALAGSVLSYYTVEKWGRTMKSRLKARVPGNQFAPAILPEAS
ncbi:peptidoglycan/LPS O-acetylase OafA/YrhL [Sphingopyxis panaciterrae]|uniref:acyltransferase family protein n=1 Tax=Sphingopyxis panaciterrae TaxID=363841 RepID=UPI001423C3E2|nr:acyltransferase [Sphingopyxis panaciterrae]NIJ38003.1 peptidoglycan/LPS O-acetylase OafA/YrhL [Sphingopyxis panaciterrae]